MKNKLFPPYAALLAVCLLGMPASAQTNRLTAPKGLHIQAISEPAQSQLVPSRPMPSELEPSTPMPSQPHPSRPQPTMPAPVTPTPIPPVAPAPGPGVEPAQPVLPLQPAPTNRPPELLPGDI